MACKNLSKYYPIVMKFLGYLPVYKDTGAIDFGPETGQYPFSGTRAEDTKN